MHARYIADYNTLLCGVLCSCACLMQVPVYENLAPGAAVFNVKVQNLQISFVEVLLAY